MTQKLLVCDDENGLRTVLVNLLKPMGYNVFQAEDGQNAIRILKAEKPDLLLLDMRLPDMDGLEILAEAKKLYPSMPVVMLSGFGDVESAVGAIKQGAFDYLSKPFRVDDVKKVVQKALAAGASTPPPISPPPQAPAAPSGAPVKKKGNGSLVGAAAAAAVIVLAAAGWFFKDMLLPGSPDKEFNTPYSNPTALCFAGSNSLWVSDWVKESIYRHTVDDKLSVEQIFNIPGSHPTGLAWDGVNLWSCNSWESKIFKHNMDDKLSVAAEFSSPGPEPSGLYWDGVNMWVCDVKLGKIYRTRITEEGLSVINEYPSPGAKPIGFFATDDAYWSADTEKRTIYKHAKDQALTVQKIFTAPPYEGTKLFLSGLAWDGQTLWTCADENAKIYTHNLKNLKEVKF